MTPSERRISTQLKSWLTAVNIPFEDNNTFITVTKNDSTKVFLYFTSNNLPPDAILVKKSDMVSRKFEIPLAYFNKLQTQLGYEPKAPINRGKAPQGKINDWDLIVLDHSEFRRVPNPDVKKLKFYQSVMDIAVNKFSKNNYQLMLDNVMESDDLHSYAKVWTINFIGLHETNHPDQNKKLLMEYLKQHFSDFKKKLIKRNKNEFVPVKSPALGEIAKGYEVLEFGNEEGYRHYKIAINSSSEPTSEPIKLSRNKYKAILEEKLELLGHDKMVETLLSAISNQEIHHDAKVEASKQLHKHKLGCEQCKGLELKSIGRDTAVYTNRAIVDQNGIVYSNPNDAARKLKLNPSNIRSVLLGKYAQTGGYNFNYAS
ncbi:MAG TPA: hypothetical protein VHD33_07430 [Legionellaceae bacterium]|nr:hypothetical protein [Legionellaceae bacterium]